jgi:LysM repeat protein
VAKREAVLRWAAPAAFLAALTVAVLLVRAGLHHGGTAPAPTVATPTVTATTRAATTAAAKTTPATATTAANTYTVQSGDTYGSIATKFGTSVTQLEALNPGVSPNALSVGQKIRVK